MDSKDISHWLTRARVNPALTSLARARSVLLLQGPLGPFFDRLAAWLAGRGARVQRIALQGGDRSDSQDVQAEEFSGRWEDWPTFLAHALERHGIDHVVLFGQSRSYHRVARNVARRRGIAVVVMEEGYFRPGFATMELDGVNGHSTTLDHYIWAADPAVPGGEEIHPDDTPWHFQKMALHASRHYLAMSRESGRFPRYVHHKEASPFWHARYWMWSWAKKLWYASRDEGAQRRLLACVERYFLVPLQHDGDSQLLDHSVFKDNAAFIRAVMASFAAHAPQGTQLVFRQHPHSRGGKGHAPLVRALARELGIASRVLHLVEGDTPALCGHSLGVVLVNSTVGYLALERGVPLMVLGDSLYRRPGVAHQGGLDTFWLERSRPDPVITRAFLQQVKNLTQVPASLYATRETPLRWDFVQ